MPNETLRPPVSLVISEAISSGWSESLAVPRGVRAGYYKNFLKWEILCKPGLARRKKLALCCVTRLSARLWTLENGNQRQRLKYTGSKERQWTSILSMTNTYAASGPTILPPK